MIASLPRPRWLRVGTVLYALAFFAFLFLPLAVVAVFAFNDAPYPAPPWRGFTWDWFTGHAGARRVGLFADGPLLASVWTSVVVAGWVTLLSVAVGTANAFLLERATFRGKSALSLLMLAPLVIPGVILGISILAFASRLAQFADDTVRPRAELPAARLDAGRAGPVLLHRLDCHADHCGAAQALRRHARRSGVQPRRVACRGIHAASCCPICGRR